MKSKLLLTLAALCFHIAAFSQVNGISFVQVADHDGVYSDGVDLTGYKTFDVYVHAENASDILLEVFSLDDGTPGIPDAQDTKFEFSGNLFQHELAGFTAAENDCSLWADNPTMEFDSYITMNDSTSCSIDNPFDQEWMIPDSITTRSAFEGDLDGDYFDGGDFWTDEGHWYRTCTDITPSFGSGLKYRIARITTNQSFTGTVQAKACCVDPTLDGGVTYTCIDTVVTDMDTTFVVCSQIAFECDFDFCENAISVSFGISDADCFFPWGQADWYASSPNGDVSYVVEGLGQYTGIGGSSAYNLQPGECLSGTFTDEAGCQAFAGGCVFAFDYAEAWVSEYSEVVCEGESDGFICIESSMDNGFLVEYNLYGPEGNYEGQCNYDLPCGFYEIVVSSPLCYATTTVVIECEDCCNVEGCTDASACNFDPTADCEDDSCVYPDGCDDPSACNYDDSANCNDGSCVYPGCTDLTACNYDELASCSDDSCTYPGCTDPVACNYNENAGCDDGSCIMPDGCTDPEACNYDDTATCNDGSCFYDTCGTCPGDADLNGHVNVLDLVSVSNHFGCTEGCYGYGDANFDTMVNVLDVIAVSSNYATECP